MSDDSWVNFGFKRKLHKMLANSYNPSLTQSRDNLHVATAPKMCRYATLQDKNECLKIDSAL